MSEYRFCFGLYFARLDRTSLFVFRRWPFKSEILIPIKEIAAVSITQITPEKVRVARVFTSGKSVWLPLSPYSLPKELFSILSGGEDFK